MKNYFDADIFRSFGETTLQHKTLLAYIEYYRENSDKLNLIYKAKMTPQGNPLFKAISKNIGTIMGEKNKVGNQSLWKLFYQKNYSLSQSKTKDLENYINAINEVIKIRKLKEEIYQIFYILHKGDKYFQLAKNPNPAFTAVLVSDIRSSLNQHEINENLGKEISKLFLNEDQDHEISQEVINILFDFVQSFLSKKHKNSQKDFIKGEIVESVYPIPSSIIELGKQNDIDITKKLTNKKYKRLLVIILILGVVVYFIFENISGDEPQSLVTTDWTPLFEACDDRFRIMIVPFNQECKFEGSMADIGKVIEIRLEHLSKIDSLNLNVRYLPNFTASKERIDSSWIQYYKRIADQNNADQLIYGATREDNCTSSGRDEICINFVYPNSSTYVNLISENNSYAFNSASREEIAEGGLQGDIDFIIYMNAINSIGLENPNKALRYANYIIDSLKTSNSNLMTAYWQRMLLQGGNNFLFDPLWMRDAKMILENKHNSEIPLHIKIDAKISLNDKSVEKDLDEYVSKHPSSWHAYYLRAFYFGLYEDSLRFSDFNMAIKYANNKSQLISIYQTIAGWYSDRFDWGSSIEWHTQAINTFDNYTSRLARGICYYYLDVSHLAIQDFNKAKNFNTGSYNPNLWLGRTFLSINEFDKGMEYYENALAKTDIDLQIIFTVIYDLMQFKKYETVLHYTECVLNIEKLESKTIFNAKYIEFLCFQSLKNPLQVKNLNEQLIKFPFDYEADLLNHISTIGYSFHQ